LELGCICDLNEDLCKERAAEFRFNRYTTRMDEMLSDPSIDVIGIYTPDPLHATHIRQCLEANKHVICTKPLLDNLKDAKSLLEAAKKTDKRVFVGQSSRFFEPMMRQRADFEAGKHGNLFSVEAHYHADHRWFLKKDWAKKWWIEMALRWSFACRRFAAMVLANITEVMGYGPLDRKRQSCRTARSGFDAFHRHDCRRQDRKGQRMFFRPAGQSRARQPHDVRVTGREGLHAGDYYDCGIPRSSPAKVASSTTWPTKSRTISASLEEVTTPGNTKTTSSISRAA